MQMDKQAPGESGEAVVYIPNSEKPENIDRETVKITLLYLFIVYHHVYGYNDNYIN